MIAGYFCFYCDNYKLCKLIFIIFTKSFPEVSSRPDIDNQCNFQIEAKLIFNGKENLIIALLEEGLTYPTSERKPLGYRIGKGGMRVPIDSK